MQFLLWELPSNGRGTQSERNNAVNGAFPTREGGHYGMGEGATFLANQGVLRVGT